MKKIFVNITRNIYNHVSFKLNQKRNLRKFIYDFYEMIRLVEFKIKSIFSKKSAFTYIIYVNPEKIVYQKDLRKGNWLLFLKFIKPLLNLRINNSVQIIDGNWDLRENLQLFNEDIKYKSYYRRFIEGIEWRDTEYYKREKDRYLNGKFRKEYDSITDLNLKYHYIDNLYRKIEREGFKTQQEIIETEGIILNYGRGAKVRKIDDDISVAIGRDGDITFLDGRHRLNIAKMLCIKKNAIIKIPVRVLAIHPKFINKLKTKKTGGSKD